MLYSTDSKQKTLTNVNIVITDEQVHILPILYYMNSHPPSSQRTLSHVHQRKLLVLAVSYIRPHIRLEVIHRHAVPLSSQLEHARSTHLGIRANLPICL